MKKSNFSFLLSWFMIGFGVSYILLNSTKWVSSKKADDSALSNSYEKYGSIESRQNINATNYVSLPKFKGSNERLSRTPSGSSNFAHNVKTASYISAQYNVNINKEGNNSNDVDYSSFANVNNNLSSYKTKINNSNYSNNISSELLSINSQIPTIRLSQPQVSEKQKSDKHVFLSVNTDMTSINLPLPGFTNTMQKADIDPGDGGDLGEPIPVGDGLSFLLLMIFGYVTFIALKRLKL